MVSGTVNNDNNSNNNDNNNVQVTHIHEWQNYSNYISTISSTKTQNVHKLPSKNAVRMHPRFASSRSMYCMQHARRTTRTRKIYKLHTSMAALAGTVPPACAGAGGTLRVSVSLPLSFRPKPMHDMNGSRNWHGEAQPSTR